MWANIFDGNPQILWEGNCEKLLWIVSITISHSFLIKHIHQFHFLFWNVIHDLIFSTTSSDNLMLSEKPFFLISPNFVRTFLSRFIWLLFSFILFFSYYPSLCNFIFSFSASVSLFLLLLFLKHFSVFPFISHNPCSYSFVFFKFSSNSLNDMYKIFDLGF